MSAPPPRLPAALRQSLQQALDLARRLQRPGDADPEELEVALEDLRTLVRQALSGVRLSGHPGRLEIARSLQAADRALDRIDDPAQRDARARLREVAAHLGGILQG